MGGFDKAFGIRELQRAFRGVGKRLARGPAGTPAVPGGLARRERFASSRQIFVGAATQGRPYRTARLEDAASYSRYRYASVVRNGTKSRLSTRESSSSTAWRRWPRSGPPNAWSSWSRISR